jgi:deazaflavin-dependent oxidoreductase (nitroreductase family)
MADETGPARDYSLFGDAHVAAYRESGGEVGHIWNGVPCLILTTSRKDGSPRDVALIYGMSGDDPVVVASKGGAPEHPLWYRDLVRNPRATVQIGAEVFEVAARTAGDDEKPELWETMAGIWPDYDAYQAKTDRPIPVVILERS